MRDFTFKIHKANVSPIKYVIHRNYDEKVRIKVNTLSDSEPCKNVEVIGYAKVIKVNSSDDSFIWYARTDKHYNRVPCEGTSPKGEINVDGTVSWEKEIWHTGGYTNEKLHLKLLIRYLADGSDGK